MSGEHNILVTMVEDDEVTYGTPASSGGGNYIRRVSSDLVPAKDWFQSAEVRPDMQVADGRHGIQRPIGTLDSELYLDSWNSWFQQMLRGAWVAGVDASNTEFTSAAADNATSKFTFAGGNPITEGFKIGDTIRFANLSEAANNGVNFRITAFGGTQNREVTVTPAPTDMGADSAFTVAVVGHKLLMGTTLQSKTIEIRKPTVDYSERYDGVRMTSAMVAMPPTGIATVRWGLAAKSATPLKGVNAPYFTSPAAAPTTEALAGVTGALRVFGVEQLVITGMDFTINGGGEHVPVVGSQVSPDIYVGPMVVTGNVSFIVADTALLEAFSNETVGDIVSVMRGAQVPTDFLAFNFQRVKLSGVRRTIGAQGATIASCPFQALLKSGGSGTSYDQSTMSIQRSSS